MKAKINSITFKKEYESKFGTMYLFAVNYGDNKTGFYSAKSKEQTFFKKGEEAEFTEEVKNGERGEYVTVKPVRASFTGQGNFGKAMKKEQTKYSGFAVSYAKDLCIAGKIEFADISQYATVLFDLMVALDKSVES